MDNDIQKAIEVMKAGGIIIFPTDTAFGIGCRIDNPAAIDKLFAIRRRPREQAMPVLVSSPEMAEKYYSTPSDIVRRMMKDSSAGGTYDYRSCKKELITPLSAAEVRPLVCVCQITRRF